MRGGVLSKQNWKHFTVLWFLLAEHWQSVWTANLCVTSLMKFAIWGRFRTTSPTKICGSRFFSCAGFKNSAGSTSGGSRHIRLTITEEGAHRIKSWIRLRTLKRGVKLTWTALFPRISMSQSSGILISNGSGFANLACLCLQQRMKALMVPVKPVIGRSISPSHHKARLWLSFFQSGTGTKLLQLICNWSMSQQEHEPPKTWKFSRKLWKTSLQFFKELRWRVGEDTGLSVYELSYIFFRRFRICPPEINKGTAGNFLVLPGWLRHCLGFLESVGYELHRKALNLSLEKLFLPVLTFLMAAGKVPGSLWRLVIWHHWRTSSFLCQVEVKEPPAGIDLWTLFRKVTLGAFDCSQVEKIICSFLGRAPYKPSLSTVSGPGIPPNHSHSWLMSA